MFFTLVFDLKKKWEENIYLDFFQTLGVNNLSILPSCNQLQDDNCAQYFKH